MLVSIQLNIRMLSALVYLTEKMPLLHVMYTRHLHAPTHLHGIILRPRNHFIIFTADLCGGGIEHLESQRRLKKGTRCLGI
jgi:hypothetical protein